MFLYLRTAVWTLKVLLWVPIKVWFYSVHKALVFSRMENNDLLVEWPKQKQWKSFQLNLKVFKCCHLSSVSNSSRAIIEEVIFLKCINAVYVIFFSYRGRDDMWCQKTAKRVSVIMTTKKASLWRLWDNKNTYFFTRWNFTFIRPF